MTGSAPVVTEEDAAQRTAHELRRLRRRGWLLVNHVTLTGPAADHVLVGPGGILAIESTWSAQEWTPDCARLQAAAERARRNALRLTVWHRLRPIEAGPVGSVVFLWGPGARGLDAPFALGGTTIVPGHAAAAWRAGLTGGLLTRQQIEAAWQELDARRRKPAVT